jgi:hypothetical protein
MHQETTTDGHWAALEKEIERLCQVRWTGSRISFSDARWALIVQAGRQSRRMLIE